MSPSSALCLVVALFASTALSFNLGHHNDLIRSVLRSYTYTNDATDLVVLGNWYTDYFATLDPLNTMSGLLYLHYDALNTQDEIREYTERVRDHVLAAIDAADGAEKRLLALGVALHAAADLMSHSNWGESAGLYRPSCGYYRSDTPTRFSAPQPFYTTGCDAPCSTPEFNRSTHAAHGGQCSGAHRDNYARPGWEEAYVYAFFWLHDWVASVHNLRPQVAADAASYSAGSSRSSLQSDLNSTWNFGTYYKTSKLNGIYKAPGSGRATPFAAVSTSSYTTLNSFRTAMGNMQSTIGGSSLYNPFVGPASTSMGLTSNAVDVRVVYIRILRAREIHTRAFHPYDLQVDPFLKATVNGQEFFTEPYVDQRDKDVLPNWKIIAFVPRSQSTVSIKLELWDQNYAWNDNVYDVTWVWQGKSTVVSLSLDMATKSLTNLNDAPDSSETQLNGVHSDALHAASTAGTNDDGDEASLKFYVDVRETGTAAGSVAANCPEELVTAPFC